MQHNCFFSKFLTPLDILLQSNFDCRSVASVCTSLLFFKNFKITDLKSCIFSSFYYECMWHLKWPHPFLPMCFSHNADWLFTYVLEHIYSRCNEIVVFDKCFSSNSNEISIGSSPKTPTTNFGCNILQQRTKVGSERRTTPS